MLPRPCRAVVGSAIVEYLQEEDYRVLAVAVSGQHAHILVELPDSGMAMREILGQCKRISSRAVRRALPGRIWARGGALTRINDRQHQRNTFHYILTRQKEGTWCWSFKDDVRDV